MSKRLLRFFSSPETILSRSLMTIIMWHLTSTGDTLYTEKSTLSLTEQQKTSTCEEIRTYGLCERLGSADLSVVDECSVKRETGAVPEVPHDERRMSGPTSGSGDHSLTISQSPPPKGRDEEDPWGQRYQENVSTGFCRNQCHTSGNSVRRKPMSDSENVNRVFRSGYRV